jgi:hypothetical protein
MQPLVKELSRLDIKPHRGFARGADKTVCARWPSPLADSRAANLKGEELERLDRLRLMMPVKAGLALSKCTFRWPYTGPPSVAECSDQLQTWTVFVVPGDLAKARRREAAVENLAYQRAAPEQAQLNPPVAVPDSVGDQLAGQYLRGGR